MKTEPELCLIALKKIVLFPMVINDHTVFLGITWQDLFWYFTTEITLE